MLRELAVNTRVIYYLMALLGMIGVLAKAVNQQTLNQMLKAAGNMSKSTHRLIKLVRAKYEHACMVHDSVENTNAFVEKYIYEYRGFLFGIHTWRQMQLLTVWFVGILAALGAFECYITYGFSDAAYQYIETGLAEMVLLFVISHLSDEQYKLNAVRMYMVDYLENNCAFHVKRQRTTDREELNVIAAENTGFYYTLFTNAAQEILVFVMLKILPESDESPLLFLHFFLNLAPNLYLRLSLNFLSDSLPALPLLVLPQY